MRRVVFVGVYQVRVPLQFFGFIYFAPSSLFPYSSFVRFLRFDIVYRSTMPRTDFRLSHLKKKKLTLLFVSAFYTAIRRRFGKVRHRVDTFFDN